MIFAVAELLARLGSVVVEVTVAVLLVVISDLTIQTVIVIVADVPGPMVPNEQLTVEPPVQLPFVVVTFW